MNRGVDILLDHAFRDHDGILEIISVPRHEGDEHIATQSEFAVFRIRTVCKNITNLDHLPLLDDRMLVDTCAAVGAHELAEVIDTNSVFRIILDLLLSFGKFAILGNDDSLGIDRGNFAVGFGNHHRTGISGNPALHTGADNGRLGDEQRYSLALHVGSHQGAIRVIMLEERNQTGSNRDQLLRRNIHVLNLLRLNFDEIATITRGNGLPEELTLAIDG